MTVLQLASQDSDKDSLIFCFRKNFVYLFFLDNLHFSFFLFCTDNLCSQKANLYALNGDTIKPAERKLVSTGISLAINEKNYGRIAPRSGLAFKHGVDVWRQ